MQQQHRTIQDESYTSVAILYQRYSEVIFAYLRRHTASREDAEDVLVEVFVAALEYEHFSTMSEKEQLAWLWRVARNKAIDAYRRSKHRQSLDLEQIADSTFDDDELAPEQVALREEEYAHLRTHLEGLSGAQQEVLRLRFTNDLRCAEIAARMGKREGAIRVMLSRTLNLLRGIYEKQ